MKICLIPQPQRLKKLYEVAIRQTRAFSEVAGRRMFALVKTGLKPEVVLAALPA